MFKRIVLVLLAAAVAASMFVAGADAGQRYKNKIIIKRPGIVVINNFAPRHRWHHRVNGTYSGDVVIFVRKGVGQWSYGGVSSSTLRIAAVPNAKIIDVERQAENAACQMQAGVCVIKP